MCPACCLEQGCVPPSPRGISALEGGNGGAGEETGAWHNGAPPVSQGTCVCQVSVKNRSWEQKREQHGLAWNGKVKGKSLCLSAPCLYFSLLQLGLRFSTFYLRSKRKVKGWKFLSPERSERLSSGGEQLTCISTGLPGGSALCPPATSSTAAAEGETQKRKVALIWGWGRVCVEGLVSLPSVVAGDVPCF